MGNARGIALIIVLAIVAILTVLVLEFSYSVWVDMYLSANYDARTQALYAAKAGVEYGVYLLRSDPDIRVDSLGDSWARPMELGIGELKRPPDPDEEEDTFGEDRWREDTNRVEPRDGGTATVLIVDEDRKIAVGMLNYARSRPHPVFVEALVRLIEDLNVPEASFNARELVEAMIDWVDNDEEGAWEDYYEALPNPYEPKSRPFGSVLELRLVAGVSDALLFGTVPYPEQETGYGTDAGTDWWERENELGPDDSYGLINFVHALGGQKINVNTAPREVLTAFFGGDTLVADQIMERRREEPFANWAQLKDVIGDATTGDLDLGKLEGWVSFKSVVFRITSIGEYRGARVKVTAIVYRTGRRDVVTKYYRIENVE